MVELARATVSVSPSACASEFILGGQRSGKSRRGEMLAQQWLAASPSHSAVFIATAQPWDVEMQARIRRHQLDRRERVPGMRTVEEPLALADAVAANSDVNTMIVVDCLTLWLTHLMMPMTAVESPVDASRELKKLSQLSLFISAIDACAGPIVIVGNEIGLGVIPMGRETRDFVDALGQLNQDVARHCERVTLMAAGLPLYLKGAP